MTRGWSPPCWWPHWTTASGPGRGRRVWVGWWQWVERRLDPSCCSAWCVAGQVGQRSLAACQSTALLQPATAFHPSRALPRHCRAATQQLTCTALTAQPRLFSARSGRHDIIMHLLTLKGYFVDLMKSTWGGHGSGTMQCFVVHNKQKSPVSKKVTLARIHNLPLKGVKKQDSKLTVLHFYSNVK